MKTIKKVIIIFIILIIILFFIISVVINSNKDYEESKINEYESLLSLENILSVIHNNDYVIIELENEIRVYDTTNTEIFSVFKSDMLKLDKEYSYVFLDSLYYLVTTKTGDGYKYTYYDVFTLEIVKEINLKGRKGK